MHCFHEKSSVGQWLSHLVQCLIEAFSVKTCSRLSESFRECFRITAWALRFFVKRIVHMFLFFVVGSGCSFEWHGSGYLCSSRRLRTSRGFFGSFLCLLFRLSGRYPFWLISPLFVLIPVGVGIQVWSSRVERVTPAQRIQSYYAWRTINKSVAC